MELIYTDKDKVDVGVFDRFEMDFEQNVKGENNTFEIKTPTRLDLGGFIYSNGSEYGGRIESIKHNTSKKVITYKGRTWRGILDNYILCPDHGEDYLIMSGDLNEIISQLILRCQINGLYEISADKTISVTYQFYRYCTLYDGIIRMLAQYGYKLSIEVSDGVALISAVPITILANEQEISNDMFEFTFEQQKYPCNHLIALGSGELKDRLVIHKYLDLNGDVSDIQYYFGADEVVGKYDYPNAESLDELEEGAIDELKNRSVADSLSISIQDVYLSVGDKVNAYDYLLDISIEQFITRKITTINNELVKYQYEIGEMR